MTTMTCEQFWDRHFADHDLDCWFSEMYEEDSFNSDKIFDCMVERAKNMNIELTDADDWMHDEFIWSCYQCAEKGLS